ncbi:MAG: endonuclease MutS2 [Bacillota bacterium]
MDTKTLKALEFSKILNAISQHTASAEARTKVMEIMPSSQLAEINEMLAEVAEADKILYEYGSSLSFAIDDITDSLDKASKMSVLGMGEVLRVAIMLRVASSLRKSIIKVPTDEVFRIKSRAGRLYLDESLEKDIEHAIISDTEMSDNASNELRIIRQRIKKMGESIKIKLQSYISGSEYSKIIQDNIVTIRAGRYVVPVKVECKNAMAGLIHDQSASGQTVYIEPLAIVEMNNTLKTYMLDEEMEIERILRDFTYRISVGVDYLRENYTIITDLDVIFAKAKYANLHKARMPIMNDKGIVNISRGRHPLIPRDQVVPTNIYLGEKFDMLFITGPNTGGKTVSLKLVGLFELMAMSGIFIPCFECELSVFSNIFSDVGDEQSIERNLSTFSSHIANIVRITENMDSTSLILLDELGAGTDPTEGAALAVSISDFIKKSNAKAIITTHFNELKEYAVVTDRVENASMDFDPLTYSPTYKLIIGTPGASNALAISQKLGLNSEIITKAKDSIQQGKVEFENVLASLEESRKNAVLNEDKTKTLLEEAKVVAKNAEQERNRLFVQRERLNENVKNETKRLVQEAMEEANAIITSLKDMLDDPTEQKLFEARKLRKSLTNYVVDESNEFQGFGEEEDGEIRVGDNVLVQPLKVEGVVSSINDGKKTATVKLGTLISTFKLSDLLKVKSKKPVYVPHKKSQGRTLRTDSFVPEINLIGQTVMEASHTLNEFIDKALLAQVNEIRVIHGHGSGKLREGMQRLLKRHGSIDTIRDGGYYEGGRGVTIATIKR